MAVTSEILLDKFNWIKKQNTFVVGFAWLNGNYYSGSHLINVLSTLSTFNEFEKIFFKLDGQFSIVIDRTEETWMACSHTWSYPLFYKKEENNWLVSDKPENILSPNNKVEINYLSAVHFLNFGVTPLHQTLGKSISQIRPGELIRLADTKTASLRSKELLFEKNETYGHPIETRKLYAQLLENFERYYQVVKNTAVLLPLTKGYDSRIVACLLKEFGHKNVICTTWGRKNNSEMQTAKKVARKLGFEYYFEEYDKDWLSGFRKSSEFQRYVNYAGHMSSMPFFYDYFGIENLLHKNIIDKETIAIPGHPGDFLKGSHINLSMTDFTADNFCSHILAHFGTSTPLNRRDKKTLYNFIKHNYFKNREENLLKAFKNWDFEERQCKFIGNSTLSYTFHGIKTVMPFFSRRNIRFFNNIPFNQIAEETLYNEAAEKEIFRKYNVSFDLKPRLQRTKEFQQMKDFIINLLPHILKTWYYPINDDVFYKEITSELIKSEREFKFKHPVRPHHFNSYIVQWYLQFTGGKPL